MLTLEFPNETHREMWKRMKQKRKDFEIAKQSESLVNFEVFEDFLKEKQEDLVGRPGLVPASYFIFIKDNEIVGNLQIRHHIEHPNLKEMGGHIGYAIVPWERGKGYGKEQLRLGLIEAKKLLLQEVMVSCLSENTASVKVIESQGGKYIGSIIVDESWSDRQGYKGKELKRYIITLQN